MTFRGDVAAQPRISLLRGPRAGRFAAIPMCVLAAAFLAGCGLSGNMGSLMVDPARYSAYRCNDLVTQWKTLTNREKELRGLLDKAGESGGGTVIGAITYRPDYESVLVQEKMIQQEAAEKKCELESSYKSDQTIR